MNLEGPKASVETAKQVINLSTGAIAFKVTFIDKFKVTVAGAHVAPVSLYVTWVLFGLTMAFALWYLMALNGNISAIAKKENGWELSPGEEDCAVGKDGNTRVPGISMLFFFLLAVMALVWVGFVLAKTRS